MARLQFFHLFKKILLITHLEWDVCSLWAVCSQVSHPSPHRGHNIQQKMQKKGLINLSEFTVPFPHSPCTPIDSPKETKMSYLQPSMEKVLSEVQRWSAGAGLSTTFPSPLSNFTSVPIHHMWWIYVIKPISFSHTILLNNKIIIYWLFKKVHMRG